VRCQWLRLAAGRRGLVGLPSIKTKVLKKISIHSFLAWSSAAIRRNRYEE